MAAHNWLAALACAALFAPNPARAQSPEALADRLAVMRADVEKLSAELTDMKTETSSQLRSLARQKADLEVELEREKVRIAKLRASLSKKQQVIADRGAGTEDLVPIYDTALAALRGHVETSMPFRRADRLRALATIDEQRVTGVMSTERALSRLWGFVEDEFRMTRENGLFRQTINLDGSERLADVIRLGMVMLYFRTENGLYGQAVKSGEGWRFELATARAATRSLRSLFDAFKKQIRVGFFILPNALSGVTELSR